MNSVLRALPIPVKAALPAILLLATLTWVHRNGGPRLIDHAGVRYCSDENLGITVAVFSRPVELTTIWNGPPQLQALAQTAKYSVAINGSYFNGSYLHADAAGLLRVRGKEISPVITDRQLGYVVAYNRHSNRLRFVKVQSYVSEIGETFAFQSGPLILLDGVTQAASIEASKNGRGSYRRTALGFTDHGQIFFAATSKSYRLEGLAQALRGLTVFEGSRLEAMNLDGGPSTAFYSSASPDLCFNAEKRLPIVLGVE